jgi:pyruvate/2-oxoglutarate dehydrogenase complex dihydrolipoamide acyltransferase (E2) component
MIIGPLPAERRHTIYFLGWARSFAPVFLDTEVDMTSVDAHRTAARQQGASYSLVTYIMRAVAAALVEHPACNVAVRGGWRYRVAHYESVNVKLTFDKLVNGQRAVLAMVMPDVQRASLDEIQQRVNHYRNGDPARMPEFAAVRRLDRLPMGIGSLVFRSAAQVLKRRPSLLGTVAVTSLGHAPVNGFYSAGGTTITIGVGQLRDCPVVRDGQVVSAKTMQLNLTFDHRAIDGAEAADLLTEIKGKLERLEPAGEEQELPRQGVSVLGEGAR